MSCRYFSEIEFNGLFDKNVLPVDIDDFRVIGVTDVGVFSFTMEHRKIRGVPIANIQNGYTNVSTKVDVGKIWVLELNGDAISRLIVNDDFYENYFDKKFNPFELTKRVALFYDDSYSYWTENVYTEAF